MKKSLSILVVGFMIFFILFILTGCKKQGNDSNVMYNNHNNLGIFMKGFDNFVFDMKGIRITAHDNETILIISPIKNLKEEQSMKFVDEKAAILEGQYEVRDASYHGEVTKEVVCPEQFKPFKNGVNNKFSMLNYQLYSTKSLTYGVCVKDLIAYRAFLGFFYCAGKGLFQIEVFVPAGDETKFNEMLQKVSTFEC